MFIGRTFENTKSRVACNIICTFFLYHVFFKHSKLLIIIKKNIFTIHVGTILSVIFFLFQVALVEIQIESDVSPALLIVFCVCTTLLVSVHLLALMISTCILPNIEAVSNVHNVNAVNESPHEKMNILIQMAWAFSTGLGIILFLTEIVLICWVKFDTKAVNHSRGAAWASTAVVIPVGIIFVIFSFHFYRKLISHKVEQKTKDIEELAKLANDIEMNTGNGIQTV